MKIDPLAHGLSGLSVTVNRVLLLGVLAQVVALHGSDQVIEQDHLISAAQRLKACIG